MGHRLQDCRLHCPETRLYQNDPRRCRSGILYTLSKLSEDGHVYSGREQLLKSAKELLQADEEPITAALDEMIEKEDLVTDEDAIFLPPFYYAECGVANKLKRLLETGTGNLFEGTVNIEAIVRKTKIQYDEVQVAAIRQAVQSKVMVLTGGPGTGKTNTILGIIAALESIGQRILLAAPTGRAAKRMSEATG